jgi:hypothetical protein
MIEILGRKEKIASSCVERPSRNGIHTLLAPRLNCLGQAPSFEVEGYQVAIETITKQKHLTGRAL